MLHHLLSLQFVVSVIILIGVGVGAAQSKMSTKQILSLVALVALGLVVVFQSYSAFSRNRSRFEVGGRKSCDACCATLVFIAISLLAIGNLTNEDNYKHGYPNWCIGVCEQQGQGSKGGYPREKRSGAGMLVGDLPSRCPKCSAGSHCSNTGGASGRGTCVPDSGPSPTSGCGQIGYCTPCEIENPVRCADNAQCPGGSCLGYEHNNGQ